MGGGWEAVPALGGSSTVLHTSCSLLPAMPHLREGNAGEGLCMGQHKWVVREARRLPHQSCVSVRGCQKLPIPGSLRHNATCSGELYSNGAPVAAQRQRLGFPFALLTTSSPGADTLARPLAAAPLAKS